MYLSGPGCPSGLRENILPPPSVISGREEGGNTVVLDTKLAQSRATAQGHSPIPLGSDRDLLKQDISLPQPRKLARSGAGSLEQLWSLPSTEFPSLTSSELRHQLGLESLAAPSSPSLLTAESVHWPPTPVPSRQH